MTTYSKCHQMFYEGCQLHPTYSLCFYRSVYTLFGFFYSIFLSYSQIDTVDVWMKARLVSLTCATPLIPLIALWRIEKLDPCYGLHIGMCMSFVPVKSLKYMFVPICIRLYMSLFESYVNVMCWVLMMTPSATLLRAICTGMLSMSTAFTCAILPPRSCSPSPIYMGA